MNVEFSDDPGALDVTAWLSRLADTTAEWNNKFVAAGDNVNESRACLAALLVEIQSAFEEAGLPQQPGLTVLALGLDRLRMGRRHPLFDVVGTHGGGPNTHADLMLKALAVALAMHLDDVRCPNHAAFVAKELAARGEVVRQRGRPLAGSTVKEWMVEAYSGKHEDLRELAQAHSERIKAIRDVGKDFEPFTIDGAKALVRKVIASADLHPVEYIRSATAKGGSNR